MWTCNRRLCFILLLCSVLQAYANQNSNFEDDISGDVSEGDIMERGELKTGDSPLAFSQETLERLALNPDIEVNIEVVNENNKWHSGRENGGDKSTEATFVHFSGDAETITEDAMIPTETGANQDSDPCQTWLNCKNEFLQLYLRQLRHLPGCPCNYPTDILYNRKIWDDVTSRYNRWRDASGASEKLSVYKPGAAYCIRSQVTSGKTAIAAQHCCYDRNRKLLTRGRDAGTPNLVSPDVSRNLHYEVDVKPWVVCRGDWTRYNRVRPPDNRMNCAENPSEAEYLRQVKRAKQY